MAKDDNTVLNAQVQYPMSDDGRSALERFAKRDGRAITSGDMKAFGNLNASDAMEALSTGQYQGLEGIDFGTSYGRPVAKLPNGAVIQVSSGEMIAAIRKREETRRKYAAQAVDQINRDTYREENRQIFQDLIQNAQFSGYLGEGTAEFYANNYEERPMQTLAYLASLDLTDRRAQRQAEREAQKTARSDRKNFMLGALGLAAGKFKAEQQTRRGPGGQEQYMDAQGRILSADQVAASSDGSVAVQTLIHLVTTSPDFQTPENLNAVTGASLRLMAGDSRSQKMIFEMQKEADAMGGRLPNDGRADYLVTQIKANLAEVGTPISDDYAVQILDRILGAEGAVQASTITSQRRDMSTSLRERDVQLRAIGLGIQSQQAAIKNFDENDNEMLDPAESANAGAALARDTFAAAGREDFLKFGNNTNALLEELFRLGSEGDQLADAIVTYLTDRAIVQSGQFDAAGFPIPITKESFYEKVRRGESIQHQNPDDVPGGSPEKRKTSRRQSGAASGQGGRGGRG